MTYHDYGFSAFPGYEPLAEQALSSQGFFVEMTSRVESSIATNRICIPEIQLLNPGTEQTITTWSSVFEDVRNQDAVHATVRASCHLAYLIDSALTGETMLQDSVESYVPPFIGQDDAQETLEDLSFEYVNPRPTVDGLIDACMFEMDPDHENAYIARIVAGLSLRQLEQVRYTAWRRDAMNGIS